MNSQQMLKNQKPEMSMIKQTVQYAFFLIGCLWLLYQIHHSLYVRRESENDFIENRLTDERIGQLLGRKGGVRKSHWAEEMELYGVHLIGDAVMMNNVTDIGTNDDGDDDNDDDDVRDGVAELLVSDGANPKSRVKLNAVILKKGEKIKIMKIIDRNGNLVLEHESGPSRRSDVEVKIVRKAENQSNGMKGFSKNDTEKHRREELVTVKAVRGSMRDILLKEM